nr:hypothetical protein [Tanacetum cinerariifolium]
MLDHQDKYMMKAQVHVLKYFTISDILPLPRRKQYCQIYQVVKHMLRGRLLASFQDHEHKGGDTRSQGGIKDNDSKIKIQDHSMHEYLASVAKYRRYLAGETGSVQDSPAPKPTKPARKPKSTAPKALPRPAVPTPVTSAQPAPTSAPAKPQEKKCKQATETSDKPPKAKKSKYSRAEDVPAMEPQGKAKVTEEQVSRGLLSLQKPKKKSPADQYIFQRRVSEPTGSYGHDESPYVVLGQSDSEEESEKVMIGADEGGQSERQVGLDPGAQAEGQTGSDASAQDKGQVGSNPDKTSEGQAGPDPGDAGAEAQSILSPVVHAGSDRKHMDLDVADVSPQPTTKQLDEWFTTTAYPRVQKNLKLVVEEQVLLEEPASSSGTLSSLQHLSKDISFGDLFFSDKPSDADKNAETEVESMVNVPIQQALSSISLMTSPIIDLTPRPESPKVHQQFKATTTDTPTTTTITTLPPPQAQQQSTAEAMMIQRISELEHIMANLIQVNKDMEERLDKHGARLHTLKQLDIPHQVSKAGSEVVTDAELAQDLAEARKKKKKSHESPKMTHGSPPHHPPPPSPPPRPSPGAFESAQVPPPSPSPSSTNQENLEMDADMAPDEQAQSSDDEDIGSAHIPLVNLSVDDPILRHNVNKPLPLGGPTGQVTIQSDFFFNKDLEYLRYGSKGRRPALSISKMKTTYYPNAGLEQMMPDQFWINECKYDIVAMYGISHQWFQRQRFYIDRHTSEGDHIAVRTHMQILSVVRIEVFSMYGYDYMKKIVLRRADLNEHVIAERDFKYLYPSDFEDLYLLNLQGHLNHLPPKDKKILTTAVNHWTRQLDATGFEYKHDYIVIDSPRAVIFRDKYGVQMMMCFNEIHKFSDGTLQQIDEALDYRVKEFRINRMNPGLNTRFWTRKDVDRCKAFMFAIQRRLRTRRIFRNLESFVGERVREGDYRLLKRTE